MYIQERVKSRLLFNIINRTFPLIPTNINFIRCEFKKNTCGLLIIQNMYRKARVVVTVLFKSLNILYNSPNKPKNTNIIIVTFMSIKIIGPVNIIYNQCKATIIIFKSCDILFSGKIIFDTNYCRNVISLNTHIKIMENSKISFANNRYQNRLILVENTEKYYQPYQFCLFQYITKNSIMVTKDLLIHYDITINHNGIINSTGFRSPSLDNHCSTLFCHYISHYKWIASAAFYNYTPEKQIIQNDYQNCNYHKRICSCSQSKEINCSIDILGPVYPGQILQTNFCNMCSNDNTVLYAEVHNINLPSSACKIAHQSQLINVIGNHSNTVKYNYTIVSTTPDSDRCELFLTASPFLNKIYDAFYVQLLPCPIGFTLQDGVCKINVILFCQQILISVIRIDYSAIRHPANTWIAAHSQPNSTNYLISD